MSKRKVKWILVAGVAVAAAMAGAGVTVDWLARGEQNTYVVPPVNLGPPILNPAAKTKAQVLLQAWPGLPRRGVLVSLLNYSGRDLEFDIRRICSLTGLSAFAVDPNGIRHRLVISQSISMVRYLPMGLSDKAVLEGLETMTLRPQESFSWPIQVAHPMDRSWGELRALGYTIDHFEVVLSLDQATELTSNSFDLGWREEIRRPQGTCPKGEFNQRLATTFQYGSRHDTGVRLASFLAMIQMFREGLLSKAQFEQIVLASTVDPIALICAHAAAFPSTWSVLLVDADPGVRREALKACGREFYTERQESLMPILLTQFQMGDPQTRVLALKGLKNHAGGTLYRQFFDTIRQAKADPDPTVSQTARQLFDWVK